MLLACLVIVALIFCGCFGVLFNGAGIGDRPTQISTTP